MAANTGGEGYRLKYTRPGRLARKYGFEQIQAVRQAHYERSFPERSAGAVASFVGRTTLKSWTNPNANVGTWRRSNQRYTKPHVAAVVNAAGELAARAKFSTNASSSKAGLKGVAEIAAKLWTPDNHVLARQSPAYRKFVQARYTTVEEVVTASGSSDLAAAVTYIGTMNQGGDRRVTWYPYAEERAVDGTPLVEKLQSYGMEEISRETLNTSPFGETPTVEQIAMRGEAKVLANQAMTNADAAGVTVQLLRSEIEQAWTSRLAGWINRSLP